MHNLLFDSELRSPHTTASTSPQSPQFEEIILNGSKMFSCLAPDCGKTFKYKSEMTRHIAIHLDQRPYVCTYPGCNKTFKRNDALTNHFRIHNKKAAHTCPVANCKAEFSTKSSLRYHLLKHEGQKTFECSYPGCNQTFTSQSQLKQHEKTSCVGFKSESTTLPGVYSPISQTESNVGNDYSSFNASSKFGESSVLQVEDKFEEVMTSEGDCDRYSIPNIYNAKNEEAVSTEFSEMSLLGKKSGRNIEDILISLLTYMTEENQQLKKKLKYSSEILKESGSRPQQETENLLVQDQGWISDPEQEQEQFASFQFDHDHDQLDVDSFFKSSMGFEGDETNEREFIF